MENKTPLMLRLLWLGFFDPDNPLDLTLGMSSIPFTKTTDGQKAILSLDNRLRILSIPGGTIKLQYQPQTGVVGDSVWSDLGVFEYNQGQAIFRVTNSIYIGAVNILPTLNSKADASNVYSIGDMNVALNTKLNTSAFSKSQRWFRKRR